RRRHTRFSRDWSSDVCSSDLIYLDYLQNRKGQTIASVYSVRPVPGAQVSAPLDWNELDKDISPSKFTIKNMPARIEKRGDLFKRSEERRVGKEGRCRW